MKLLISSSTHEAQSNPISSRCIIESNNHFGPMSGDIILQKKTGKRENEI